MNCLPEEQSDFGFALKNKNPGWSEPQRVLGAVLAEDDVHVHAVHLQLFGPVQKLKLGLSWS